ncbi:MAG TPA: LamG domain-containing protein [Puia sp.]|uniref:LamG domain-containing protein n=1 Tax=Puia sp. TaxID=2045100 RepID=UPI002CF3088A|nr:LamG domain-containing protein [Puia sp.]HVU96480.1 LamG domain-containing protein [Puia sp.]
MTKISILGIVCISLSMVIVFSIGCNKNNNPLPPVHDTTTVVKQDTTKITDTLYATKPDPTVNLKKGLLLYLPFSGNIADSSGNGNPTTALGSVLTYDQHGYASNAFGGTGNGERILVTNNGSIQFDTAWSISLDFMVRTLSVRQAYISMVDPVTGNGPSFVVGTNQPTSNLLDVGAFDVAAGCDNDGQAGPNKINDLTSFTPQLNAWYNIIATYHRDSVNVYVNGNLISSVVGTGTQALLCPASQIVIGGWWNNDPITINGKLDEVRLYNRVVTPHEITWLSRNFQVSSNKVKPGLKTH